MDFLLHVAAATGVSIEWLLTGEGSKFRQNETNRETKRQGRRVLVVDDKDYQRESIANLLEAEGYIVHQAHDIRSSLAALEAMPCEVVVTDLRMPNEDDGLQLLREIQQRWPNTHTIMITVHAATARTAVEAVRLGAFDYLVMSRSFPADLRTAVANALADLDRRAGQAQAPPPGWDALLGVSPAIEALRAWLPRAADAASEPVLLLGEPGTGKEFVARLLHAQDAWRHSKPFVPVKCGAMDPEALTLELFGQARPPSEGVFVRAAGGTVFLDEFDRLAHPAQIDLMRLITERVVVRRGELETRPAEVRLICASHADVDALAEQGALRRELLSRLSVLRFALPPLRERREDIPVLARAFAERAGRELGKPVAGIDAQAMELLISHDWPDNVRGLLYVIQRAAVFCDGPTLDRATVADALGRGW